MMHEMAGQWWGKSPRMNEGSLQQACAQGESQCLNRDSDSSQDESRPRWPEMDLKNPQRESERCI